MIDYLFNYKNPLYHVKEVIFLCSEITILVSLLRQNHPGIFSIVMPL